MTEPPGDYGDRGWDQFDDFFEFDEHWRKWIDNPPLGWRPPKNKRVFAHVYGDMRRLGWVVRIDTWIDAQGVHLHFRWAAMVLGPKREDHDAWMEAGQPQDEPPPPDWWVAKRGVMGWVLNWWQMAVMEEDITDPKDDRQNGKGQGELTDSDIEEL